VNKKRGTEAGGHQGGDGKRPARGVRKPPLRIFTTTLWEYPSQHYDLDLGPEMGEGPPRRSTMQGDKAYAGATPSWVIWQLLQRYTREGDLVVDPMCGSGTTLDVARDLKRRALGYDLTPSRTDIFRADARKLPLEDGKADFVFIDPPYSTHIRYSEDPKDIGVLDAGGEDGGQAYYEAMERAIGEIHRVLKNRRYMALYVSDSWKKRKGGEPGSGAGMFMPIGFELFSLLRQRFKPVDIIAVVRHNQKLQRGNWNKAAEEGNFFLRGFNYLFIMKKEGRNDER
jgi:adenine-specific DNA-methyltransferase